MKTRSMLRRNLSARSLLFTASALLPIALPLTAQPNAGAADTSGSLASLLKDATGDQPFAASDLLVVFLAADPKIQEDAQAAVARVSREAPSIAQQKGAVAESAGTTTLAEKTGMAEFLNLAIEQGAITKTTSGTSYTLQTTPYLLLSKFGTQDVTTWQRSDLPRQIALSATFNQVSGSSDTNPSRNNLERAEAKYTYGQHSARDREFLARIRSSLGDRINPAAAKEARQLDAFWESVDHHVTDAHANTERSFREWRARQKKPIPLKALIDELHRELDPLRAQLNDQDQAKLQDVARSLDIEGQALQGASDFITAEAKKYVAEAHPEFSLAYAFQRDITPADFSDLKLLFSYKTASNYSVELNGEVMLNDRSTAANGTRLERLRGYAFEADLTMGKFANNLADFTAAAKLTRPTGDLRDERSVQAKLDLYLLRGVTVPVSLSYTNHTDDPTQPNRSQVRVNVGLSLDADALMGAAGKGASAPTP